MILLGEHAKELRGHPKRSYVRKGERGYPTKGTKTYKR